jgi:hypothetical protein
MQFTERTRALQSGIINLERLVVWKKRTFYWAAMEPDEDVVYVGEAFVWSPKMPSPEQLQHYRCSNDCPQNS